MAEDFKSGKNLNKLLEVLQDVKEKDALTSKIDDLSKRTTRTSKKAGDLFKMVGDAVGESYGEGYKPDFTIRKIDKDMLPAKVPSAGQKQVIPTKTREIVGDIVETTARHLPVPSKGISPVVKEAVKKAGGKLTTAGLGLVGALLDEEQVDARGYDDPAIQGIVRENKLGNVTPEQLQNVKDILGNEEEVLSSRPDSDEQPRMSKKIMSRMPSEPSANAQEANMLNQMAQQEVEEVSEADRLAKQIDQAKPESVKSAVKEKLAQKKEEAKSPYEDILAQMKELQEGGKGDLESAKKKDALLGFLNTLNQSLGKYDQAAASRAARTPMEMLKQVQVKSPEFARQAKEDQQTAYGRLLNQLSMARAEEKEKTDLSEKEKDRQLKRELAQQDREAKLEQTIAKAAEKSQGLTEGQKAVDKAFAKDYADYVAGGGFAQAKGDIGRLDEVLKDISDNKDMFTGPLDKLVETSGGIDWVRSVVNPKLQDTKDRLEQIIQQDLRKTLGPQFTEKEGKQFLERSFNPKLGAEENIKRIKSFIVDVKKRAEQKERAIKEYESKGTLKDFKGNVEKQPKEEKTVNKVRKRDPKSGRIAVFDADTKKFLRYE